MSMWRMRGRLASAFSPSALSVLLTVHSMFDWPEQSQTSPIRTSDNVRLFFPWTSSFRGPPASRAGSSDHPLAVVSGGHRDWGGIPQLNPYSFAVVGPAPDRNRQLPLQDHVVTKDLRQANVGLHR